MSRAKTVSEESAAVPAEDGASAGAAAPATSAASRTEGPPESASAAASRATTATESAPGPASAEAETGAGEAAAGAASRTTAATEAAPGSTAAESGEPASDPGEAEGEAAETDPAEAQPAEPAKSRPARRRLPAFLLAAAVLLTGAGVWFTLEARATAANPAAANLALTDVGATADVTSAVTIAMNQIFSYSYDRTDVTEKAAAAVLRGAAKDSYDKLFAEVRRKAPEQKLVLSSRVSAIAVQELRNGHARLLVFLDQSAVRADNNATDSAAAQLSVTAEHTDGHWVVTALEPR